jgi:8-oxo-dGTP pyrophosphatase MutT (NUDIX family)
MTNERASRLPRRDEVSAGGVVFRLRDDGGFDVALIRTHEGRWQLPKGWIEDGEQAERAATREVREEAGVDAEMVGPLDAIEYWYTSRYGDQPARVHKLVHFFLLRYVAGSTDDHDHEVTEARWADIGEADRMLAFKDERRIVAMAREALRQSASQTGGEP